MSSSVHKELRHRGKPLVAYSGEDLWKAVGGSDGVAALINDLYRRIEQDELLRVAFPHVNSQDATSFFFRVQGSRPCTPPHADHPPWPAHLYQPRVSYRKQSD